VTYRVRFSAEARSDIERLYQFLADHDIQAAESALETLGRAWDLLSHFPFASRKADPDSPFLRELVIPFGHTGYVALFEIESDTTVTLLALRHQREDDYH
jgi:plasmid stabilization system protein ParE